MSYSLNWQKKIEEWEQNPQRRTWDDVLQHYHFNEPDRAKKYNLVTLTEGVWISIEPWPDSNPLRYFNRKVRGITNEDVYYDGDRPPLHDTLGLGGFRRKFRIDDETIDLSWVTDLAAQRKLLEFIKDVTGVSDKLYPEVPKGILNISALE